MEESNNNKERITVVVDGFNLFIRNFMAVEVTNTVGEPIGGIIGFLRSLNAITQRFAPEEIFVVWESGGPSPRRKAISKEYKANRAKIKDFKQAQNNSQDMKSLLRFDEKAKISQLSILNQILKQTPICQIFVSETECDDIIAYLIKDLFRLEENKKIIVSNDKDFYQLLDDPKVSIYDPATKTLITDKTVQEKFGVSARNFCLAKTLAGDVSDNIEGIPGVGFKTVSKRFQSLLDASKDVSIADLVTECKQKINETKKPPKAYKDILEGEDLIRRNWSLMYLNSSNLSASQIQKINYTIDNFEPKMNKLELIKILMKNGINNNLNVDLLSMNFQRYLT